jgi:hypothetical protein
LVEVAQEDWLDAIQVRHLTGGVEGIRSEWAS